MRVFVTGATGHVGSAVVDACVRAGHEVTALVRTMAGVERLANRHIHGIVGDLASEDWQHAAAGHDVFVHAAFERSPRGPDLDRHAIETLVGVAAAAPSATIVYTSGLWVLGPTREPATEAAPVQPVAFAAWRPAHEQRLLEVGSATLRTVVVRPGIVYGGSRGIVADMLKEAANGLMRVIGPGENHWPGVYDRDLADLYVRLIASPDASGIFHATNEADETVNEIVAAIASQVPTRPEVRHMPLAEARAKLGPIADALAIDQIVRSPRARALGWTPALGSISRNIPRLLEEWRNGREEVAAGGGR